MIIKPTQTGDKRVVKRFLILPLTINKETRWLEFVKIEQHAYDVDYYFFPWHNIKFLD